MVDRGERIRYYCTANTLNTHDEHKAVVQRERVVQEPPCAPPTYSSWLVKYAAARQTNGNSWTADKSQRKKALGSLTGRGVHGDSW